MLSKASRHSLLAHSGYGFRDVMIFAWALFLWAKCTLAEWSQLSELLSELLGKAVVFLYQLDAWHVKGVSDNRHCKSKQESASTAWFDMQLWEEKASGPSHCLKRALASSENQVYAMLEQISFQASFESGCKNIMLISQPGAQKTNYLCGGNWICFDIPDPA